MTALFLYKTREGSLKERATNSNAPKRYNGDRESDFTCGVLQRKVSNWFKVGPLKDREHKVEIQNLEDLYIGNYVKKSLD